MKNSIPRRSPLEIKMAVLIAIEQKNRITNIMDISNVPWAPLQEIIKVCLKEGLVEKTESNHSDERVKSLFSLTETGRKKLQLWREFIDSKNNKRRT